MHFLGSIGLKAIVKSCPKEVDIIPQILPIRTIAESGIDCNGGQGVAWQFAGGD